MGKLNFIDLFCGAGGFSKGFEIAGYNCLLGVDFDKDSIETFNRNHKSKVGICAAIQDITNKRLKEIIGKKKVDVVIGGPPCQGFSTVGKGQADDPRNTLFLEFLRVVKATNPKVVVMENVTGLLAKKNEKTFNSIVESFANLGYVVDARVLAAEEYGVPEVRRRTIIICSKVGVPTYPQITHGKRGIEKVSTLKDWIKNLKTSSGETFNHDPKMAQVKNDLDRARLKYIPEGRGIRYKKDEKELLPRKLWYDVVWEQLREGRFRQTKLQRLSFSKPSYTIMTSRTGYFHPKEDRYLTPREAAAIQTFPNDFVFCGSQTSQFRQIGNAVPVLLASRIGESVAQMIKSKSKSNNKAEIDFKNFKKRAFHYNQEVAA